MKPIQSMRRPRVPSARMVAEPATNGDGELRDDLRNVQLVLNLEAVGRATGDGRDYRLKGIGLAHGERAG